MGKLMVKIIQDTCDGFYEDLIGKEFEVIEVENTEDDEIKMYKIRIDRPSYDPYLEGKFEELVASTDIEIVS